MATSNPWTQLARREVYANPWIRVSEDDVIRPDGQRGIYGIVHFCHRAIGVLAINERDEVLLVGQYRYPLDQYSWEIPEGGGPYDEEPLDTAKRELLEETGYSAQNWRELGRAHLSNCVSDELAVYFLATELQEGKACPEPTEQLQVRWVSFAECMHLIETGQITDAVSILAIQRYALSVSRSAS